ncbi:WYL domain-containing protein [Pseudarthrobacter sp. J64]|uniref:helix-turn-helix transcriptional regulator n=1 Tax=Pseudarthrobacter sp. J64 TaxID=3116485 RepID=UPI002E812B5D|nr:WYL domain-containing protein [Pseudarthrobacter sp. J64]MEE2569116.1 WYL domain-containing protein [Pseudarthrobacter sp. J64]
MSATRTERLLNLLMALLNTRYGLRRSELREKIYPSSSDTAFGRMFERDKNDLRDFGFDVETVMDTGWGSDDPATTRYRIGKESNRLPDVQLSRGEWAVLLLAAQLWEQEAMGTAAANALRKLQAAGGAAEVDVPPAIQPRIKPAGQAFDVLVAAMHARNAVTFRYLAGSTGVEELRTVEPWGLGSRFGHWYLAGRDRQRDALRYFRLSRFTSDVSVLADGTFVPPSDFDIRAELAKLPELPLSHALVEVPAGRLLQLRRRAETVPQGGAEGTSGPTNDDGTDVLRLPFRDAEVLAEELASYGPQVRVLEPEDLASSVRRRLHAATRLAESPVPAYSFDTKQSRPARPRTSEDQLRRMLELVPFLVHNQGLHIQEVADKFGVTRNQLEEDLRILICTGLPEGYPGDLFDIQWEDDHVFIIEDLELTRPVRFTVEEACALLTGLSALNGLPEPADDPALESVTLKLLAAAGEEGLRAASLSGPDVVPAERATMETISSAIASGSQLHLRYVSPLRDEVSERNIDPLRLFSRDNVWYVEAWCHGAGGIRNFRLDRMESLEPNGLVAEHGSSELGTGPARPFTPRDEDTVVTLQLTRQGSGLADDYFAERTANLPDGGLVADIRIGNADWIPMLVAQHGGQVRVLAPEEHAKAARNWVESALHRYGG